MMGGKMGKSIGGRLGAVVAMALFAMSLVVGGWLYVFSHLRIGGPVYQRLSDNAALAGDAEPPPLFIVETYLALSKAKSAIDKDVGAQMRRAEADQHKSFEDRYSYWQGQALAAPQRSLLNGAVHDEAEKVFAIAEKDLFPALDRGDHDGAETAFRMLTDAYERHHAAVVELIKLIDADHVGIEAEAASAAAKMEWLIAAIMLVSILSIAYVGWAVRRSILVPLKNIESSVRICWGRATRRGRSPNRDGRTNSDRWRARSKAGAAR